MLNKKHILIGVCGGIAAYKVAYIVRNLIKAGALVKVIMTDASKTFIGPLTLATLSKNPVYSDFFDEETGTWSNHVELASWADLFIIAPATSNTIAKMANGICDNLLLATYFSAKSTVMIAPAMDLDMADHPSLSRNLSTLEQDGVQIIPSSHGELASGLIGNGRMADPEIIHTSVAQYFSSTTDFQKKKILVNAGPTHEPIDPVRFIGNRSSGKMGVSIANELASRGAWVMLVLGPTNHSFQFHSNVSVTRIQTAQEMRDACVTQFKTCDAAILSAAVADFTPKTKTDKKIKKTSNSLELQLVKTPDTLAELGTLKTKKQVLVGFALETDNELENAKNKLTRKGLDMIVLNSLSDTGAGFGHDTNKITTIDKTGEICTFGLKSKTQVAKDIVDKLKVLIHNT
ncbi:MAG: phosphopantothenoylcysteine decarboxylase/phosphopantothenate--cysteine ligase [Bacteroidia bacterium]|jgi:phosphopantothenoylcysteine decarboxylase/phosphopantothenate--cysteine ligase